ncbi:hypothetical protein DPEC_G00227820 [Dallia pectoralis]|uniref:Uncharacterized protein n=1 Tax=Dallia pectoralis TaxID=75939 RepID=A0ACC2G163_DALPE|nr:hypothetical protein DPEC_G00227820 [Dallia pectoralis]
MSASLWRGPVTHSACPDSQHKILDHKFAWASFPEGTRGHSCVYAFTLAGREGTLHWTRGAMRGWPPAAVGSMR